jgi:PKHD-type hydroxylase
MLDFKYIDNIPTTVCDTASEELIRFEPIEGLINQTESIQDHMIRKTIIRFAPEWHWLNGIMYQLGMKANISNNWWFYIDQRDTLQFAEYSEGQHYHWHRDTNIMSGKPTDRKITVVCMMSNQDEYEGGQLEIKNLKDEIFVPELNKGDVIAFPSFLLHRVTPVTKGKRYTATMWLSGPAFK